MYKNIHSSTTRIVPNWKLSNSPSTVEGTKKLWHIHTVVYKTIFIVNESTLTSYSNGLESHKLNVK